jgi:hypothetical protein
VVWFAFSRKNLSSVVGAILFVVLSLLAPSIRYAYWVKDGVTKTGESGTASDERVPK